MTRIVLACDFYPPFLGGVELQTKLLAEELAERGHTVHVATVWHEGLAPVERARGVTVHRLRGLWMDLSRAEPGRRRYHPPFPDPLLARRLADVVEVSGADVVDASGWTAYSARLALTASHVPLVVSARDFGYVCATRTFVRRGRVCSGAAFEKCLRHANDVYGTPKALVAVPGVLGLRRWLVAGSAAVHVPSRYVEEAMRGNLTASGRTAVTCIPDAIRLAEAEPGGDPETARWFERLPSDPFILFVGALQRHKGVGELLEAYQGLHAAPPLVVIGTRWPDSPDSWPNGVTTLTDVPNEVVRQIWDRALFGVLPSLVPETFGLVILEAMRSGKPMVASSIGGPLDIVGEGRTGLLVPPGDVRALRAAMQTLLDDEALRSSMGALARARVAELFSTDVVIPRYEAFYEAIAAAARAGRRGPTQDRRHAEDAAVGPRGR